MFVFLMVVLVSLMMLDAYVSYCHNMLGVFDNNPITRWACQKLELSSGLIVARLLFAAIVLALVFAVAEIVLVALIFYFVILYRNFKEIYS